MERGYSIHFYIDTVLLGASCLRELAKDTLAVVNTVKIPVNSYNAFDMPADFVDEIAVGIPVGNFIKPLSKKDSISPLRNSSAGEFVPYTENSEPQEVAFGFPATWFWNVSDHGEPTGRFFGAGGGASSGYKKLPERRQFQLTENLDISYVVLMYISDGQQADNASQVDTRAVRAIHSYIDWQRSPNASYKDSGEARTYYNERRLLRSAISDLTIDDIKDTIHKNTRATPKG